MAKITMLVIILSGWVAFGVARIDTVQARQEAEVLQFKLDQYKLVADRFFKALTACETRRMTGG